SPLSARRAPPTAPSGAAGGAYAPGASDPAVAEAIPTIATATTQDRTLFIEEPPWRRRRPSSPEKASRLDPALRSIVRARLEADESVDPAWGALVLGALEGDKGLEAELSGAGASRITRAAPRGAPA